METNSGLGLFIFPHAIFNISWPNLSFWMENEADTNM